MKTLNEASPREMQNMTSICQKLQDCMVDLSENWNKVDELLSDLRDYGYEGMNDVCEKGYSIMDDYENLVEGELDGLWEDIDLTLGKFKEGE